MSGEDAVEAMDVSIGTGSLYNFHLRIAGEKVNHYQYMLAIWSGSPVVSCASVEWQLWCFGGFERISMWNFHRSLTFHASLSSTFYHFVHAREPQPGSEESLDGVHAHVAFVALSLIHI